jgi:chromosomal replication initiator protein
MEKYSLSDIWKKTLAQIEVKVDSPIHFKTWFSPTELVSIEGKKARIGVRNSYASDWLKKKHSTLIQKTLSHVAGEDMEIVFEISKNMANIEIPKPTAKELTQDSLLSVSKGVNQDFETLLESANLNADYTFRNFVVGPSNRLAHAATEAVAETLGKVYNPLFMYGGTGLGKTHLAQAVANKSLERSRGKKVLYIPSENFLNEMVGSIKTGKTHDFRNKYRFLDLLIIDDIQLISKWEQTQDELFNTFNALHSKHKQIILISDRPPENIHNLESRLKSRFQGGMVIQVEKPDFETRVAIVENKAKSFSLNIPEHILHYIAENITDNVRQLEGAIKQIGLYNQMHPESLSVQEVASILKVDTQSKRKSISPKSVIKAVAKEFRINHKDIMGSTRKAEIAFARQVSMYLLREDFNYKLEEVAHILNKKDHTTVIHAVDKIKSKQMLEPEFSNQLDQIRRMYINSE